MKFGNVDAKTKEDETDIYGNEVMLENPWIIVNKNIITASEEELASNSRSRSAKLRVAERKAPEVKVDPVPQTRPLGGKRQQLRANRRQLVTGQSDD